MGLIGGINLYSMQSAQVQKKLKESLGVEEQVTTKTEVKAQKNTEMNAQDVLNFMANQSVSLKVDVKKTIKVCHIASGEQYERISNMMKDFEARVESGLQTLGGEFPNLNLSENAKMKIVLNSLDRASL